MATGDEVIDLCDVKTVKSEDSAVTVPLDVDGAHAVTDADADDTPADVTPPTEQDLYRRVFTENWVRILANQADQQLDEKPLTDSAAPVAPENLPPQCCPVPEVGIPPEVAELVHNKSVIKLIDHLAIFAISRATEKKLTDQVLQITSDIDPQINFRIGMGFHQVYDRCIVLFYEALAELTELLPRFPVRTQTIVILWMYNMVEIMCKNHNIDTSTLRDSEFIENLFRDFLKVQLDPTDHPNMFYETHRKISMPTLPDTTNGLPTLPTAPVVHPTATGVSPVKKSRGRSRTKTENKKP